MPTGVYKHKPIPEEVKLKIGLALKGKSKPPRTEEHKRNLSLAKMGIGHPHTEESKRKISLAQMGNKYSLGYKHTVESRKKLSEAKRGIKFSQEHKDNIRKNRKGIGCGEAHWNWKGGYKNKLILNENYRALKMKAVGLHTLQEWEALKEKYNYMCLCCKRFEPEIRLTEDHIIPLSMGGTNDIKNIQPLCRSCNSRKCANTVNYAISQNS